MQIFKIILAILIFSIGGAGQMADDICREFGWTPSFDPPQAQVPYVFGKVVLTGFDPAKLPVVSVILQDRAVTRNRLTIGRSGNYCFRRSGSAVGGLVVEVDGFEVVRRSLPSLGAAQQREDFEIRSTPLQRQQAGVVATKFSRPPNEKTVDLYRKAADAENNKDLDKAIDLMKQALAIDPEDFIGWAKLGTLYFLKESLTDADSAFRRSLELKPEYTPAWINVAKMRVYQKQYGSAIEILKHALTLDPTSARTYQLLGEAYLQNRQGTLGVEALNEALKMDPIGMAECHLTLAHLYDLAGAKGLSVREYKAFLEKVPNHADKKKFEKYVKENSEKQ